MTARGRFSRNPISLALKHPALVAEYLRTTHALPQFLGVSRSDCNRWRHELVAVDSLPERLVGLWEAASQSSLSSYTGGATVGPQNEILYLIMRSSEPEAVVETGVAAGFSSAYILQALADNGRGHLYSIDLPPRMRDGRVNLDGKHDRVYLPDRVPLGAVVPSDLRGRWTLTQGSSREELPSLCDSLGRIDVFWHDSDHSYQNMTFEFETVWAHIPSGGYLLADDVNWNSAYRIFVKNAGGKLFTWFGRGALRKETTDASPFHSVQTNPSSN